MIETCTTRRMIVFIVALLLSSLIILVFEEYIEDSELASRQLLKQDGKLSYAVTGEKVSFILHAFYLFFSPTK
jgi:hypothetical protein